MQQVRHLLEGKGDEVYAVAPDAPVLEAIKQMAERRIGALLVLRDDHLLGIVTERDYARKIILQGRSSASTAVHEIMGNALTVGMDASIGECMRLCTDSRVRHLPVLDDGKIVGLVSIGDLVKAVIDAQAQEIEHLQRYIAG